MNHAVVENHEEYVKPKQILWTSGTLKSKFSLWTIAELKANKGMWTNEKLETSKCLWEVELIHLNPNAPDGIRTHIKTLEEFYANPLHYEGFFINVNFNKIFLIKEIRIFL